MASQRFLVGWGSASDGQLGRTSSDALTPRPLPGLPPIQPFAVVPGLWSSIVITPHQVFATQQPSDGVPRSPTLLPKPADIPGIVSAARGRDFTLLLSSTGALYSLGAGAFGELGLADQTSASVPTHIAALRAFKIVAVTAAEFHWLALDATGAVFSCGNNASGQLGLPHSIPVSTPTRVSALWPHPIVAISTGDGHSAALSACGKLFCFGSNKHGQLGNASFRVRVMSLTPAPVPLPPPRTSSSSPISSNAMAVDSPPLVPTNPPAASSSTTIVTPLQSLNWEQSLRYVAVACGSCHTVALRSDGALLCWGMGENGRLGTRATRTLYEPTETVSDEVFVSISAGERHSAALTADGRLFMWGDGTSGQLGDGNGSDKYVPVQIEPPRLQGLLHPQLRFLRVQCGGFHTLAIVGGEGIPVYNPIEEHERRIPRCQVENMLHAKAGLQRFGSASVLLRTFLRWGSGHGAEYKLDYIAAETAHLQFMRTFGEDGRVVLRRSAARIRHQAQVALGLVNEDLESFCEADVDPPYVTPKSMFAKDGNSFRSSVANCPECGYLFFLAMMNPIYGDSNYITELSELAAVLLRCEEGARDAFLDSVANCEEGVLLNRFIRPLQEVLTDELRAYRRITRNAIFATKMLALCYHGVWRAAQRRHSGRGIGVSRKEFYNETVSEMVNFAEDYERWMQSNQRHHSTKGDVRMGVEDSRRGFTSEVQEMELPPLPVVGRDEGPFAFCSYSFLLTEAAKFKILKIESQATMSKETMRSMLSVGALQMPRSGASYIHVPAEQLAHVQFLMLHVRREHIVSDAYMQVHELATNHPRELRKPLRVIFDKEEGVDEGGVSKEFYQVLLDHILSPDYGMFEYDEENRLHWFRKDFLEPDLSWTLIGIMFGVAAFNSILLDVQFPPVVYRKLAVEMRNSQRRKERERQSENQTYDGHHNRHSHTMGDMNDTRGEAASDARNGDDGGVLQYKADLEDVKEAFPAIGNSLQQLHDYTGDDVEDVFCLSFEVSYRGLLQVETVELIPNGGNTPVTRDNREDFIERYCDFLINGSIERAFKLFATGFTFMVDGPFMNRLTGDELETLVIGEKELNFSELRKAAQYEGFTERSDAIVHLWQVLDEFDDSMKRLFLSFVTGTDRAPIGGLGKLRLIIQRAGEDSNRLPTSHTCFNVLLLPDYGTRAKLRNRLSTAIGNSTGFGLQ